MRLTSSTILTLTSLTGVAGFAGPLAQNRRTAAVHVAPLNGIRCENKYYQLEELEDKESCTTELFLTANGQVEFGETDVSRVCDARFPFIISPLLRPKRRMTGDCYVLAAHLKLIDT